MRDLVETVIGDILARERATGTPPAPLRPQAALPASRPLAPAAADARHRDARLWKSCRDFEALFLQQMLAEMRKGIPRSKLLDTGFAGQVQEAMMDQAVAQAAAKRAPLGLAEAMYRQLEAGAHAHGDAADKNAQEARQIPRADGGQ